MEFQKMILVPIEKYNYWTRVMHVPKDEEQQISNNSKNTHTKPPPVKRKKKQPIKQTKWIKLTR